MQSMHTCSVHQGLGRRVALQLIPGVVHFKQVWRSRALCAQADPVPEAQRSLERTSSQSRCADGCTDCDITHIVSLSML